MYPVCTFRMISIILQLTVTVTDYNEAAPRFRLSLYESNPVPENVPVGTVLMRGNVANESLIL